MFNNDFKFKMYEQIMDIMVIIWYQILFQKEKELIIYGINEDCLNYFEYIFDIIFNFSNDVIIVGYFKLVLE